MSAKTFKLQVSEAQLRHWYMLLINVDQTSVIEVDAGGPVTVADMAELINGVLSAPYDRGMLHGLVL